MRLFYGAAGAAMKLWFKFERKKVSRAGLDFKWLVQQHSFKTLLHMHQTLKFNLDLDIICLDLDVKS